MSAHFEPVIEVNPENQWRLASPGSAGWARTPHPGPNAKKKYFMVSVDTHLLPPPKLFFERIEAKYRDLLPRMEVRDGKRYVLRPNTEPQLLHEPLMGGEDLVRARAGAAAVADQHYAAVEERVNDQDRDGVDGEVIFPNGPALMMWASSDPAFVLAQCQIWNDWVIEYCKPFLHRCAPVAAIPTGDVEMAIAEVARVARLGLRVLSLPSKPIWGLENPAHAGYNHPQYNALWAAIQAHGLPITFHVASGKDPRGSKGYGGAVINYVVHAAAPSIEPVVTLCASGVIERFPGIRFATIEANAGWLAWTLDMMDEAYLKHHFWVKPKLKELPSTYFRTNGAASIGEDRAALLLAEPYGLENNLMWANDYPHHEGSWPHSAEAVERHFGGLQEQTRANILGLNAARLFGFDIPDALR